MKLTGNGSRNRNAKITDPDTCGNRRCHGSGFFFFLIRTMMGSVIPDKCPVRDA